MKQADSERTMTCLRFDRMQRVVNIQKNLLTCKCLQIMARDMAERVERGILQRLQPNQDSPEQQVIEEAVLNMCGLLVSPAVDNPTE